MMSQTGTLERRPRPVDVGFSPPDRQRRATVAFRILLLLPHVVFGALVQIALMVVLVLSWFAALVLGRVPNLMAGFLGRAIQYVTRVYGYGYLLTDRYPPFRLKTSDYPISVLIESGPLNRLAVLFRLILQIPAYFVYVIVSGGLQIVLVFAWLVVLVAGRMPIALHQAVAAVLRYQTRFFSYACLVTAAYPAGLFGDVVNPVVPPSAPEPDSNFPSPIAGEAGVTEDDALPLDANEESPVLAELRSPPLATKLPLLKSAKRLVGLTIGLGAVSLIGNAAYIVAVAPSLSAWGELSSSYEVLSYAFEEFHDASAACQETSDIECQKNSMLDLEDAMQDFSEETHAIKFPLDAQTSATRFEVDVDEFIQVLSFATSATSDEDFARYAQQIPALGNRFDIDFEALVHDLI